MSIWIIALLALGGIGLYLALPKGRQANSNVGGLLLAGAAAALVGLIYMRLAGTSEMPWFAGLSVIGLFAATRVVTHRRPVYSALYFILVVIAMGGLLILLDATFLAAALVIIYAGAILVTYIFVIMLAQQSEGQAPCDRDSRDPLIGAAAGMLLMALLSVRIFTGDATQSVDATPANHTVQGISTELLTYYAVGVEVAGVLLLAAMVGAIAIAMRKAADLDVLEETA